MVLNILEDGNYYQDTISMARETVQQIKTCEPGLVHNLCVAKRDPASTSCPLTERSTCTHTHRKRERKGGG